MPLGDTRTFPGPTPVPRAKRKLGKRDAARIDADAVLDELRPDVVSVVARVLVAGGSIQFGTSRDGTAMLVRAWVGGDVYEDWDTSVGELSATIEALTEVCEAVMARATRPLR